MKRTPLSLLRFTLRSVPAAAALLCLAPALHAVDRFWIDTAGGPFADIANWSSTSGGAGGASVPVAGDNANFTLNNTTPSRLAPGRRTKASLWITGM